MANQDDTIYTELLLEFLSTVYYALASREARSRLVSFRLGGVSRECSLRDFGRRTGIYTEEELQSRHFTPFLQACIQGRPDRAANATIWATLSNLQFEAGSARESQLHNPLHRLMHRIISTSVMQKQGSEKVSGDDMTFMWALLDPTRFLHLPYALAISLSTRAAGASSSSPTAGGHYITRLARSYGLLTAVTIATLTAIPPVHTSARFLENMGLIYQPHIYQPQAGHYVRVATEAPRAPRLAHAQEEEGPARRHRRVVDPPA
ncbi:hypothetical protein L2E82_04262 [Cichorium intybus]|uniref:Uncharacterized protein n=1 Tax=Cichorium intybus TaxID=13427 RepID=A0ACB9H7D5_CICIN|nr:hypothetical protein L2E82_04262 [Cichorium intybus]